MNIPRYLNQRPILVFPIAVLALLIPIMLIEFKVLRNTGGVFVYPLDDAFMHLTIARNLALHGTWGITPEVFQPASSSLLYTLVLASWIKLLPANPSVLFLINGFTGIILLRVVFKRLQKENIGPFAQLLILLAVIFLAPLPVLLISGMEDSLQCLLTFLFIFHFSDWMEKNDIENRHSGISISSLVFGVLCCAVRYEGLFLISIACLLLLYKRKIRSAFILGILSILPILVFGIYSLSKGSYFLPNPVLLKSEALPVSLGGIVPFILHMTIEKLTRSGIGISLVSVQYLLIILPLSFVLFSDSLKKNTRFRYILILLMVSSFLQITLNGAGWFYRYEAYLMFNSVVILSILFYSNREKIFLTFKKHSWMLVLIIFILFLPMFSRSSAALLKTSKACINIYDQEYQMAMFLRANYQDEMVAAYDFGAIAFLKKDKVFDLSGLANTEITRSKIEKTFSPTFLDSFCRSKSVQIAVLDDHFLGGAMDRKWFKAAEWTIPNNIICGDSAVSFYALKKELLPGLKKNLQIYQPHLPVGVRVRYY